VTITDTGHTRETSPPAPLPDRGSAAAPRSRPPRRLL